MSPAPSSAEGGTTQPHALPPARAVDEPVAQTQDREKPARSFRILSNDEDSCCVQAFTKSAKFAAAAAAAGTTASAAAAASHLFPSPVSTGEKTASSPYLSPLVAAESGGIGAQRGVVRMGGASERNSSRCGSGIVGGKDPRRVRGRGDMVLLNTSDGGEIQGRRGAAAAAAATNINLAGPVFYRVAWRRTGGKLFVWKIVSRWVRLTYLIHSLVLSRHVWLFSSQGRATFRSQDRSVQKATNQCKRSHKTGGSVGSPRAYYTCGSRVGGLTANWFIWVPRRAVHKSATALVQREPQRCTQNDLLAWKTPAWPPPSVLHKRSSSTSVACLTGTPTCLVCRRIFAL